MHNQVCYCFVISVQIEIGREPKNMWYFFWHTTTPPPPLPRFARTETGDREDRDFRILEFFTKKHYGEVGVKAIVADVLLPEIDIVLGMDVLCHIGYVPFDGGEIKLVKGKQTSWQQLL